MSVSTHVWVRVGGGFEVVPGGDKHGPAELSLPPPGGPWQALVLSGQLVGWSESGGDKAARNALDAGQRLAADRRAHLLARLDHKLRSSILALQEAARAAAFRRSDTLASVYDQAQEVGRRAAALAAAALEPKEPVRTVVLAAAFGGIPRLVLDSIPSDAVARVREPVLQDVLNRICDWMREQDLHVSAVRVNGWWRLAIKGRRRALEVPELGEPLVRLLVDLHLGGWLDASHPDETVIFLPAADT